MMMEERSMSQKWLCIGTLLIVVGTLLGSAVRFTPVHAATGEFYVPGEVLVRLTRPGHLPNVAARYNLDAIPLAQVGRQPIYRMRILDGVAPPERAAQLAADPQGSVAYAEPNYQAAL